MATSYIGPPRNLSTAGRNALAAGSRPPGMQVFNTDNSRLEFNAGSDAVPNWLPLIPNQFGTAFPTTGLFNGYRYTRFFTVTGDAFGVLAADFIYRADLDATYPWHAVGSGEAASINVTGSMPGASVYASGASLTIPSTGIWTVLGDFVSSVGSGAVQAQLEIAGVAKDIGVAPGNQLNEAFTWQGLCSTGNTAIIRGQTGGGAGSFTSSILIRPRKLS